MKKGLVYFMLGAIVLMTITYLTVRPTSEICELHEKLFLDSLNSGRVVNKFVDSANHSIETVVIKEDDRLYKLLLVPDINDKDFEKIRVNDKITKSARSFVFKLNDHYEFEFKIDCEFEK